MFVVTYALGGFIFGWAKPVPVNPYYFKNRQRGMMVVGLAGPATNFLIAVAIAILLNLLKPLVPAQALFGLAATPIWFDVLFLAYQVNIVLGLFNLLPIPPLDGSRVVGGFLSGKAYATWVSFDRYGIFVILAFFFLFQRPFFAILQAAFRAVSRVLLPAYF